MRDCVSGIVWKLYSQPLIVDSYCLIPSIHRSQGKGKSNSGSKLLKLIMCIVGIYVSFIVWAWLQERVMATSYKSINAGEPDAKFRFVKFLNLAQCVAAAFVAAVCCFWRGDSPAVRPLGSFLAIAATNTIGSPFRCGWQSEWRSIICNVPPKHKTRQPCSQSSSVFHLHAQEAFFRVVYQRYFLPYFLQNKIAENICSQHVTWFSTPDCATDLPTFDNSTRRAAMSRCSTSPTRWSRSSSRASWCR